MDVTLQDIVGALTKVRAHAESAAERHPECQAAFLNFKDEIARAQKDFILRVRPDLATELAPPDA